MSWEEREEERESRARQSRTEKSRGEGGLPSSALFCHPSPSALPFGPLLCLTVSYAGWSRREAASAKPSPTKAPPAKTKE